MGEVDGGEDPLVKKEAVVVAAAVAIEADDLARGIDPVCFGENGTWHKPDGSERMQLSPPLFEAIRPRWSPDGKLIAFEGVVPGAQRKIYVVSSEGGPAQELVPGERRVQSDPDWSADGRVVFALPSDLHPTAPGNALYVVNLQNREVAKLPGSEGLRYPRWSPDGRYIPAATVERPFRLMLFDFRKQQWSALSRGGFLSNSIWSRDGRYLYFQDLQQPAQPVFRIRLADRKEEQVLSCEEFIRAGIIRCGLASLAPDVRQFCS